MAPTVVTSAKEAIEAAGGVPFVARLFGFKSTSAVYNWYRRGLPPEARKLLGGRLDEVGVKFSDDLFRQYDIGGGGRPAAPKTPRKKNGGNPRSGPRAGKK